MSYDFVVEFKKGKDNVVEDALSRQTGASSMVLTMISLAYWDWLTEIKCLDASNPKLVDLWQAHQGGTLPWSYAVKNEVLLCKNRLYILRIRSLITKAAALGA